MRILIVSQPASAGVAVVVSQHVAMAIEHGHEVSVVCPPPDRGPLAGWVVHHGARLIPIDMKRSPSIVDIAHVIRLRSLMRNLDIVHLHSSKAGVLGRVASRLIRSRNRPRIVFTPHAWSWLVGGALESVYKAIERLLQTWTDAIVAVSDAEAEIGKSVLGDSVPLQVIPNGIDTSRFTPDEGSHRESGTLLICVGRLSHQKGQDIAIQALSLTRHSTATLRLVGDGDKQSEYEQLAVDLGVGDRVEFAGFDAPLNHYRSAAIVLVPSRWDGMSLGLLEAMSCGAAIIASDVAGVEALSTAGVVVDPGDAAQLAAGIDMLLANPDLRSELGNAARRRALNFDIRYTLRSIHDLWTDLVK